jgi:hypothetical protein
VNKLGGGAVIALFFLGVGAGLAFGQATRERPPFNPYGALPAAGEPAVAADVAAAIAGDDARALSRALDANLLDSLGQALDPVVDVYQVRFLGGTEKSGDTLTAYVVEGRDLQGNQLIVGFVLRVRGDKIVGVN